MIGTYISKLALLYKYDIPTYSDLHIYTYHHIAYICGTDKF